MTPQTRALMVHLFTATGAVFAMLAMLAAVDHKWSLMYLWLVVAFVVDGIDGPLARKYHVKTYAAQFDGVLLDLIIDSTDAALVDIQLDVYWAQYGGIDPIPLMRRLAGRVPTIHVKDAEWPYTGIAPEGGIAVDYPAVLATAKEVGVEWAIVEQDKPDENDPVGFVTQKRKNLEAMLGA